jgi:hypothetical protein
MGGEEAAARREPPGGEDAAVGICEMLLCTAPHAGQNRAPTETSAPQWVHLLMEAGL